jgi:hypothetical protein
MELSDIEQNTLRTVVDRFVNLKQATDRVSLVRTFEDPDAIDRLHQLRLLKTADGEFYLPTALSFHYCGNDEIEAYARRGMEIFAEIFRKMFLQGNANFSPEVLREEAKKVDQRADERMIRLGLYVAPYFGIIAGYAGGSPQQPDITPTSIGERIVKLKNIDTLWDKYMSENTPWPVQDSMGGIRSQAPIFNYNDEESLMRYEQDSKNPEILVFISHSSKDVDLALTVIELLKAGLGLLANQIRCSSVDGYRLPVGAHTETQLREEVNLAPVVIGLITPSSLASAFVMFELGARWGANNFLAPLLAGVKTSELSGPLSFMNALHGNSEPQLHDLLKVVGEKLGLQLQDTASYLRHISAVRQQSELIAASTSLATGKHKTDKPPKMQMRGPQGYFYQDGDEVPFCPKCWEKDGKAIHLPPLEDYIVGRGRVCRVCSEQYVEFPAAPKGRRQVGGPWS